MSTVEEISDAVKQLPKRDLARFRKWFAEYDAALWDRRIEQDVAAGRLETLAREALRDHRAGRTRDHRPPTICTCGEPSRRPTAAEPPRRPAPALHGVGAGRAAQ